MYQFLTFWFAHVSIVTKEAQEPGGAGDEWLPGPDELVQHGGRGGAADRGAARHRPPTGVHGNNDLDLTFTFKLPWNIYVTLTSFINNEYCNCGKACHRPPTGVHGNNDLDLVDYCNLDVCDNIFFEKSLYAGPFCVNKVDLQKLAP